MPAPRSADQNRELHRRLVAATAPVRPQLALGTALSLITVVVIIAQSWLLARLIDGLAIGAQTWTHLSPLAWILLAVLGLRALLLYGQETLAQQIALMIKTGLRDRLSAAFLRLGPSFVSGEQTGELVTTAVDGVEKLDEYYSRYLPLGLHMAVVPPVILIVVAAIDPLSGLVLLITGPLIPFLMWLIGSWATERTRRQWKAMSLMSAHFLDVLQGLTTLKLFGRARRQTERIAEVTEDFRRATMSVLIIAFLSSFFLELSAAISTAIIAVEVGIRIIGGHLDFPTGLFLLLLAPEYYLPFRRFGAAHHAGMEATAAAERIFEVLDAAPPSPPILPAEIRAKGACLVEGPPHIALRGVSLSYPGRADMALDGVDLELLPQTITAVVGPSGAGKTSLIRLLMAFQSPTAGTIEIDSRPLSDLSPRLWRRRIALVSQSPHLFAGTLLENLLIARPSATIDEVEAALDAAQALDFALALPRGLDTPVGERGARLSGGQRQRLGIARAFLKDAPLLLMDEPSSQLDPLTEEALSRALHRLVQGRTAVVVAHRINTIVAADQIAVFDAGRVVELGTDQQLRRAGGLYSSLVASPGQADQKPGQSPGGRL